MASRDILEGQVPFKPGWATWLFSPTRRTSADIRSYLLAQLLNSPQAALMGAVCSLIILVAAFQTTGSTIFGIFIATEIAISTARILEWKTRARRLEASSNGKIDVGPSVLLSSLWSAQQGAIAFTIISGNEPVLQVLSATLIMAIIGPICARHYAAPRFATLLLLLCDLPFVAGAIAADDPLLLLIVPMTPPFLLGARQIILNFHSVLVDTLLAREEQRYLAAHDSLTGLLNRQGMDERLSEFGPNSGRSMVIVSLDLDDFKTVNDTHGHGAGDTVLREVAKRISSAPGQSNIAARVGGDEFIIVMPDCDARRARQLGDYLVDTISKEDILLASGVSTRTGASVGYACLPEDAVTTVELRQRADEALYSAKSSGKSTCHRFGFGRSDVGDIQDSLRLRYS